MRAACSSAFCRAFPTQLLKTSAQGPLSPPPPRLLRLLVMNRKPFRRSPSFSRITSTPLLSTQPPQLRMALNILPIKTLPREPTPSPRLTLPPLKPAPFLTQKLLRPPTTPPSVKLSASPSTSPSTRDREAAKSAPQALRSQKLSTSQPYPLPNSAFVTPLPSFRRRGQRNFPESPRQHHRGC